jgi:hypothetical protein
VGGQIMAVVSNARAAAMAADARTSALMTQQGTQLGFSSGDQGAAPSGTAGGTVLRPDSGVGSTGNSDDPTIRAAGWHTGGAPEGTGASERPPRSGDTQPSNTDPLSQGEQPLGADPHAERPTGEGKPDRGAPEEVLGKPRSGVGHQPETTDVSGSDLAAVVPPASLGSGNAGAGLSVRGAESGGGFKLPSSGPGSGGGLGGGGLPTQGLPSSASSAALPRPGSGMTPPVSPPAAGSPDFSRGFGAGLGSPAPFASPVLPPASTEAGSAGPPGSLSANLAPISAASGVSAQPGAASPTPTVAGGPSGGATAPADPMGPMGPLPPFGSDVPRTTNAAPVSPSAGPAPAPAGGVGGSSSASVPPLPPGVVGSGLGAAVAVSSESVRSALSDPLMERASALVRQLLVDSKMYPYVDWCVGVFRTASGVQTVIVSSEGAGYIPGGVFLPRSARSLFADRGLSAEFRARWFGWANPAETMLAYADLVHATTGNIELWALVVSTNLGGSSAPARDAEVPHFDEVHRDPVLDSAAPSSQLDNEHMHRLETVNTPEYLRLTGFGDGTRPDRSEAWRITQAAAQTALARAGASPDFAVPPVIWEMLDLLNAGVRVPKGRWEQLRSARDLAVTLSSGLRPGLLPGDTSPASPHARAHHDLARLMEILLMWSLDDTDGAHVKYPEIAYLAIQIEDSAVVA